MRRNSLLLGWILWLVSLPTTAWSASPAIAQPGLAAAGKSAVDAKGVVFFLKVEPAPGVAAVGTAHTLRIDDLARAGRVEFFLPRSLRRVAASEAFLVPPGRPFSAPGASLRDDFVVYALADPPKGVRALEPDLGPEIALGARVLVLGPPRSGRRDEQEIFGTVVHASADRIEFDLDVSQRLSGWGGAPVLHVKSERVIGLVEAAVPSGQTSRVMAAPIGGVLDALAKSVGSASGARFEAYASTPTAPRTAASPSPTPPAPEGQGPLRAITSDPTRFSIAIEYPPQGGLVTDSVCGSFIAGRAIAMRGAMRRFDVVMVLDTSRSTIDPAGTDVNGNGEVGVTRMGRLGSIFGAPTTDPGDSILAAEVAAARQLLRGLDPRSTRVALVGFAGDPSGGGGRRGGRKPAFTLEPLTHDYRRIEHGLDDLLASEPEGNTHMAAGVDQATIELLGLRGSYSQPDPKAEKVMFFFTDGQPTLPYGPEAEADNVRAVLRAANRASRGRVKIHSFAIGPDALEGPIAAVEMASRTQGYFTPVRHPGDLVDIVEEVSFANLDEVQVIHPASGATASPFRVTADGSWAGFLKLSAGANRIRIDAIADDGSTARQQLDVTLTDVTEDAAPMPKALVVQRNRLLEDCLLNARRLRLSTEKERADKLRRTLKLEIEKERAKARQRADEQRKALELEGELDDD